MKRLAAAIVVVLVVTANAAYANIWQDTYNHSVFIVGDGLTVGTIPYISQVFPGRDVQVEAFWGTDVPWADKVIQEQLNQPPVAPTVVIASGQDDREPLVDFRDYIIWAIGLLGPSRRVFIVNYAERIPGAFIDVYKNRVVNGIANAYPNVHVIDWASVIGRYPKDFGPDGIHYTSAGYLLRTQTIAAAIGP